MLELYICIHGCILSVMQLNSIPNPKWMKKLFTNCLINHWALPLLPLLLFHSEMDKSSWNRWEKGSGMYFERTGSCLYRSSLAWGPELVSFPFNRCERGMEGWLDDVSCIQQTAARAAASILCLVSIPFFNDVYTVILGGRDMYLFLDFVFNVKFRQFDIKASQSRFSVSFVSSGSCCY